MTAYYLPKHVSFCGRGDLLVFLDLRKDEYTLIQGACARAVHSLLSHRCDCSVLLSDEPASPYFTNISDLHESLAALLAGGFLTTDENAGKPIAPTPVILPTETLGDLSAQNPSNIRLRDIYRFAISCIAAVMRLRVGSFACTIESVQTRKTVNNRGGRTNLDDARRLVAIFNRLRPFFPGNYLCLFESLALLEFLARYQLFPSWIFAVQLHPWAAHCWVQLGTVAFNEDVEEVLDYLPILVV